MRGLTFLFTLIVLLIAGTAAQAEWRSFSTTDVNLRDGPGTEYGVVNVVPEGTQVFVDHCRRGWCAVDYRGEEGWMSRDYLARERIRNSRHLKENDRLEYERRDDREPYYDDENYREVIVVDPPHYRNGWRRFHEGRRIRDGRRVRDGRRSRIARGDRPRGPRADRDNRRNKDAKSWVKPRKRVVFETHQTPVEQTSPRFVIETNRK